MARVQVTDNPDGETTEWTLWFQWCRYFYDADDFAERRGVA